MSSTETPIVSDDVFQHVKRIERSYSRLRGLAWALGITAIAAVLAVVFLFGLNADLRENKHEVACKDNAMASVLDAFGGAIQAAIAGDADALHDYSSQLDHLGSLRDLYEDCHARH
jgi:hypothetical protein